MESWAELTQVEFLSPHGEGALRYTSWSARVLQRDWLAGGWRAGLWVGAERMGPEFGFGFQEGGRFAVRRGADAGEG